jgi:hypothetical protein
MKPNPMRELLFRVHLGCSESEFFRKVGLCRNPERGRCPICKKQVELSGNGDRHCENFSLNHEKDGKCYWHRYADGTNYWTSPEELMRVMSKKTGIPMPCS